MIRLAEIVQNIKILGFDAVSLKGVLKCARLLKQAINFFPFTPLQPDLEYGIIFGVRAREPKQQGQKKERTKTNDCYGSLESGAHRSLTLLLLLLALQYEEQLQEAYILPRLRFAHGRCGG